MCIELISSSFKSEIVSPWNRFYTFSAYFFRPLFFSSLGVESFNTATDLQSRILKGHSTNFTHLFVNLEPRHKKYVLFIVRSVGYLSFMSRMTNTFLHSHSLQWGRVSQHLNCVHMHLLEVQNFSLFFEFSLSTIQFPQVQRGNFNRPVLIHREWTFRWRRRHLVSSS